MIIPSGENSFPVLPHLQFPSHPLAFSFERNIEKLAFLLRGKREEGKAGGAKPATGGEEPFGFEPTPLVFHLYSHI